MTFMLRQVLILVVIFLPAYVCEAEQVEPQELVLRFDQDLIQGAMITGFTTAASLTVLDRTVQVDTQGSFVFGLGRDTASILTVVLHSPPHTQEARTFAVAQRQYDTQLVNGVEQKYVEPPAEVTARIQADAQAVQVARAALRFDDESYLQGFIWPAKGRITGVYGSQRVFNGVPKRPHYGLDIAGPTGTPVYAPAAGLVTLVHDDMYYSGGTLVVHHGRGISSTFIHLSKIHVFEGAYVKQGQLLADIGATGRVTGPHLDWRINWFDQRLDPALLLPTLAPEPLE